MIPCMNGNSDSDSHSVNLSGSWASFRHISLYTLNSVWIICIIVFKCIDRLSMSSWQVFFKLFFGAPHYNEPLNRNPGSSSVFSHMFFHFIALGVRGPKIYIKPQLALKIVTCAKFLCILRLSFIAQSYRGWSYRSIDRGQNWPVSSAFHELYWIFLLP